MSADIFCFSVCWCANAHKETLVFECYTNAEYCESIAKALFDFVYGSKLEYERHASLLDIAANLPEGRAALDAYYFIPAFTRNEEIRTSLNALCPEPGYSIKDLAAKAPVIKDADYALLTRFIKWCAFDVASDISRLFELLFKQPRTKSILNMRADNKTLDAAGKVHSVTRERIRQIEGKAKRIFNSWHNRTKVIYKIAALTQGSILSHCCRFAALEHIIKTGVIHGKVHRCRVAILLERPVAGIIPFP